MDDLVSFLRARLDEEHELAQRLAERYRIRNPERADDGQPYWPLPSVEVNLARRDGSDPDISAGLDLIKAYSPTRVLAEVAAKRRIIDHVSEELEDRGADNPWWYGDKLTPILEALLLPYADHPEYQQEWRP